LRDREEIQKMLRRRQRRAIALTDVTALAAGWYLRDLRPVRIKFKPLQADANGIYPKGQFGHSEDFGGIGPP
jgi:hypothetical protein